MHSEQGAVARDQDNLGTIIECLTPRVSITALSSSSTPLVHLASVWRFFDSPYGHSVLFPRPDGTLFRTYWVPVLSKIELYPVQRPSLTISNTASRPYPDLLFSPLIYEDRRPVAERQPFIEMIKSLARTNPVIQEGTIMDIDPKSWFSVVWSQISVDPQYLDLQRDHLLTFYRFNTPQTVSWLTNARSSDHDHHLEMYIKYNRFYTEKRSASNKQLRFSPSDSGSITSPLKLLNLSQSDIQHALDTHDCTYSLLTVHSPMLPTCTSDLTWARNGFQPERSFASPGIINSLKTHRSIKEKNNLTNISSCTSFEDTNTQPHTKKVYSKTDDHTFLQRKQLAEKWVGAEFLRVKDAFCIHHLCRESAPSAETILDVFNYFVEHLHVCTDLQVETSTIVLRGNISRKYHEPSILSWSERKGYLMLDATSTHFGYKRSGRMSADDIRKIFHRSSYSLSEYPRTIIHLYAILLVMQQHSEVYKDLPLYYRIIINALYYTGLQQIMSRSKVADPVTIDAETITSYHTTKNFALAASVRHDGYLRKNETGQNNSEKGFVVNLDATAKSTIQSTNEPREGCPDSIIQPKTIAGLNYSIDLLPPYNISSFNPESTSRISSILDSLTLQQLHSTLCDLMKHFYPANGSCVERVFSKTRSIPASFKYLHNVGFKSIMNPLNSLLSHDMRHTANLQLMLSHPIFKRSSSEYKQSMQAVFHYQTSSSLVTSNSHCSSSIVITTTKHHNLEKLSSDSTRISPPSSAVSTAEVKESLTDGSSDHITIVSDAPLQSGVSTCKTISLNPSPLISTTSPFDSSNSYLSLLLDDGRRPCSSGDAEVVSFSKETTKASRSKARLRETKRKELSITVGTSLVPGDKERCEKIILEQYRTFIKLLYHLLTHKQNDKTHDYLVCPSSSHAPYLTFYRRDPSSDCSCDFCHQSFIMQGGTCSALGWDRGSGYILPSPSSRASFDAFLCESATRRLVCSPGIRRYICSDKALARFTHFSANYKLTEFSNLSAVAIKFLSSRSIMDGIRLSFVGCLPLNTFHTNLEFYRSTDNSEENFKLIRSKDSKHILKFSEYPVIYHIFLEIILNYVPVYHDLISCMPPKLDKFILEPRVITRKIAFTDTIDDSAIQLRGGHVLAIHPPRQRPSSAEGGSREHARKPKAARLKHQRVGHSNQPSNRSPAVNSSK
ncbi:Hypothetical protein DHA2_153232 [Giardia duodenalis]|uniref:Uncharacterized protein n=1 Tax=Giardia intestinalis TaxID=5741 RepID=V6TF83_GIAIN|nr:Hypothetical protein DHA2_153232 [Giardia intestinalis]